LFLITAAVAVNWQFFVWGVVPVDGDSIAYFYPLTSLTGWFLRGGNLPVWSPYQMSGMPLMADPQAGWGSVSTMLAYTLLPMQAATALTLTAQLAFGAVGMLLFLRSTRLSIPASTFGALAYGMGGSGFVGQGNLSLLGAHTWTPWLLLGVDVALRADGRRRLLGWAIAGFAASQVLSTWLGQGAYYAFAAAGLYFAFQVLLGPSAAGKSVASRLRDLVLHSAALAVVGLALSAWVLFPRLELISVSNLRGGYAVAQGQQFLGGTKLEYLGAYLALSGGYLGATVVLLALAAMLLRPDRTQVFYAAMCVLTFGASTRWLVVAARDRPTVRALLDLVPGLLDLHFHFPGRSAFVWMLFGSALAAASLERLLAVEGRRRAALGVATIVAIAASLSFLRPEQRFAFGVLFVGAALCAAIVLVLLVWRGALSGRAGVLSLIALTTVELVVNATYYSATSPFLASLDPYFNETETMAGAALLRAQERGRFYGYYPEAFRVAPIVGYRNLWLEPTARTLLTSTQATAYHLEDAQGYNPIHLAAYDRLMRVANGRAQNYRNAYLYRAVPLSPLMNILNVRYTLTEEGNQPGGRYATGSCRDGVCLRVNTGALPRAWVVHEVVQLDDDAALRRIHQRRLDPRRVAAVSRPVNGVSPAAGPDAAAITSYAADRIEMRVNLSSPGLVVLSELDYPAWKVKVDGRAQPVVRADGALRAVAAPAGEHTIVWYYRSTPTQIGFIVSGVAVLVLLLAFFAVPAYRRRRVQASPTNVQT